MRLRSWETFRKGFAYGLNLDLLHYAFGLVFFDLLFGAGGKFLFLCKQVKSVKIE